MSQFQMNAEAIEAAAKVAKEVEAEKKAKEAEAAALAAEEAKKAERQKAISAARHTEIGGVTVRNAHLVSHKLLTILGEALMALPGHNVWQVVFGEETPANDLGVFYPGVCTVGVNLYNLSLKSAESSDAEGACLQMRHMLWLNTCMTIAHELHHAHTITKMLIDGDLSSVNDITEEQEKAMEVEADAFANTFMTTMAKKGLVEAPAIEEEPYFGMHIEEYINGLDEEDENGKRQKYMAENGVVYMSMAEDVQMLSLKEFMRCASEDPNDESWNTVTQPADGQTAQTAQTAQEAPVVDEPAGMPSIDAGSVANAGDIPSIPGDDAVHYEAETAEQMPDMGDYSAPAAPAAPQLAPTGLSGEEYQTVVRAVLNKLFSHMFNKCGYMTHVGTDPSMDVTAFSNPGAVLEPVCLTDIPNADKVFVAMDTMDAMGKTVNKVQIWQDEENRQAGWMKGAVIAGGKMPCYKFYMNENGNMVKYAVLPMNPNKRDNGDLKKWAIDARNGHCIAMVMYDQQHGGKMAIKMEYKPDGTFYYGNPFAGN